MKIGPFLATILVCSTVFVSPCSSAEAWQTRLVEWSGSAVVSAWIGGAFRWVTDLVSRGGPPHPYIGAEKLQTDITVEACQDSKFDFDNGYPPETPYNNFILKQMFDSNNIDILFQRNYDFVCLYYF